MTKIFRKRRTVALIILGIGVLISIFIIFRGKTDNKMPFLSILTKEKTNPSLNFTAESLSKNLFSDQPKSSTKQTDSSNYTDALAQLYLQEILKKNPNGPQIIDGQSQLTVPAEQVFDELIQSQFKNPLDAKIYTEENIKILADNSRDKQLIYIENFRNLYWKNFGSLNENIFAAIDRFLNKNDTVPLEKHVTAISNQIYDLIKLPVPSLWKLFHIQVLNLWQKNLVVHQEILNLQNDPLKTYLVLDQLMNISDEFESLNKVLDNRFVELTLQK